MAHHSKKLVPTQCHCHTMEKELLAIVLALAEFWDNAAWHQTQGFADHRNLTFANLNSSQVLCWRLCLKECSAKFLCIPGKDNASPDAFSCLPHVEQLDHANPLLGESSEALIESLHFHSCANDTDVLECLINFPAVGSRWQWK